MAPPLAPAVSFAVRVSNCWRSPSPAMPKRGRRFRGNERQHARRVPNTLRAHTVGARRVANVKRSIRMQVSHARVLTNNDTGQARFFIACENLTLLPKQSSIKFHRHKWHTALLNAPRERGERLLKMKRRSTLKRAMREESAPLLVSSGTGREPGSLRAWRTLNAAACVCALLAVAGLAAVFHGGNTQPAALGSEPLGRVSVGSASGFVQNEFSSFAPGCPADMRHNQCGPFGEYCGCIAIKEGVAAATGRAIAESLLRTNIFFIGDSTSKMAVQHGCRALVDPLVDPHGASCFREDGMPTVYDTPRNLRPLRPGPSPLAVSDSCCDVGGSSLVGGSCCMTMLEAMTGGWCATKDATTGELGGLGFVHVASSFKDTPEVPCEYQHARDLPTPFGERADAAVNQFAKHVRAQTQRHTKTVVVIDVNVWMGLETTDKVERYYGTIVDRTREAIQKSQLPTENTTLMLKTLYQCGDENAWHCLRNNEGRCCAFPKS